MRLIESNSNPYIVLLAGILGGATAIICIRSAQDNGMSSLALATIRQLVAVAVLAPLVLRVGRDKIASLEPRQWSLIVLAGLMLGVHFVLFFYSLEYAPVLTSLTLGNTTPFFTALIGWLVLNQTIGRRILIGAVIALAGIVVVGLAESGGSPPTRSAPLLGNSLAVGAAMTFAVYFTAGRSVRAKLDWLTYSWLVFCVASVGLLVALPLTQTTLLGYTLPAYLWTLGATVLAQIIAHSAFNYALGTLSPTVVSLILMVIPGLAAILAGIFLEENPGLMAVVGSLIIIVGIMLANLSRD